MEETQRDRGLWARAAIFYLYPKIPEVLEARRQEMVLEGGKMLLQLEKELHARLVVVGVHVQLEM